MAVVGRNHLTFETAARIAAAAPLWQRDGSKGAFVWFLDPDGHRLELHDGTLDSRLAQYAAHPAAGIEIVT